MSFVSNTLRSGDPYAKVSFYQETNREIEVVAGENMIKLSYSGTPQSLILRIARLVGLVLLAIAAVPVLICSTKMRSQMQAQLNLLVRSFSKQIVYVKDVQLINNKSEAIPQIINHVVNSFLPLLDLRALTGVNRHLATLNSQLTQIKASELGQSLVASHRVRQIIELAPAYYVSADGRRQVPYSQQEIEKREGELVKNLELTPLTNILASYAIDFRLTNGRGYYDKSCGVCLFTFLIHHIKARRNLVKKIFKLLMQKGMAPELLATDRGLIYPSGSSSVNMSNDYPDNKGVPPSGIKLKITPAGYQNINWMRYDIEDLCQQFQARLLGELADAAPFEHFVGRIVKLFYNESD